MQRPCSLQPLRLAILPPADAQVTFGLPEDKLLEVGLPYHL